MCAHSWHSPGVSRADNGVKTPGEWDAGGVENGLPSCQVVFFEPFPSFCYGSGFTARWREVGV